MMNRSKKYGVGSMRLILLSLFIFTSFSLLPTSVNAQSVDLLWQGETYAHPFYQGRALWSNQSQLTLLAVPQGLGASSNLNYKWSKNGTVLGNVSGIGRNSLTFVDTLFSKPVLVKIQIISMEGDVLAENSLSVVPTSPQLHIYENNPLYGFMFHREVGEGYALEDKEVTFAAFPFFTPGSSRQASNLNYTWSANNGVGEVGSSITYRAPEEGTGTALIRLNLSNEGAIMPALTRNFLIKFGNENE